MNTESLTAEERKFAEQLARLGPHGEPSAALDAKILAAAHAAVMPRAHKQRVRWPLYAGAAASVLLAVGIAFQLRMPHPPSIPVVSEAPVAEKFAEPAPEISAPPAQPALAEKPLPPPPPKSIASVPPPRVQQLSPAPAPVVAPPPPAPAPAIVAEEYAPAATFAREARADTTPAAETELLKATANAERQRAGGAKMADGYVSTAAPALAAPPPPPAAPALAADAAASGSTTLDRVIIIDAHPVKLIDTPVEQDVLLPERKWRKRIEQRLQQGDHDGARNSLRLFVGEYPQAKLPPELRALLEE
jgi:hypothetical protein